MRLAKTPVISGKNNKAYVKFMENNAIYHSLIGTPDILSSKLADNPINSPIMGPAKIIGTIFDFRNLNHSARSIAVITSRPFLQNQSCQQYRVRFQFPLLT